jgi:diguanylate cyclase (GGDEF)-like protein/PAS domain S-box-containing protein
MIPKQTSVQIHISQSVTADDTLSRLIEDVDFGVVVCDVLGNVTVFNKAARQIHAISESGAMPRRWPDGVDLYYTDAVTQVANTDTPLFRALNGHTTNGAELVLDLAAKGKKRVLVSGRPIQDASDSIVGASISLLDVTSRHEIEQQRMRLAAIVDSSQEAILAATNDGIIAVWNEAAERLFGYSVDDMMGRHVSILSALDFDTHLPEVTQQLVLGQLVDTLEAVHIGENGEPITMSMTFSPIRDSLGEVLGLSCVFRDITDKKAAENELRERESTLRAVLDNAPVILYAADEHGIVTMSEGRTLKNIGLAPGESVGRSVFEFAIDDVRAESFSRALAGEALSFDTADGGVSFHNDVRPLRDKDGRLKGFFGVCLDISERVRSEEMFRVLFENSSDAHLVIDETGIIDCNSQAIDWLKCSDKSQLISHHPSIFSPVVQPDGRLSSEKSQENERLALKNGFHRFEWMHRRMNGEDFLVEVTLTPIALNNKPAILAVWHDLTNQKLVELQIKDYSRVLEIQKHELERANRELEKLATTDGLTGLLNHRAMQERLAHEVEVANRHGLPLSVIMLDVDLFKDYNDSYGHPEGDGVLKRLAIALSSCARECDTVSRYGGEEFLVILPVTDIQGAAAFAERLRHCVEEQEWPLRKVTASFGVANFHHGIDSTGELITLADDALYGAKTSGRNCVSVAARP